MSLITNIMHKNKTFISYITAGDGGMDYCLQVLLALVDNGVDVLEIGMPFSDPVADGPVIQAAMQRSLQAGCTLDDVLALIRRLREHSDVPVVLFSYYNPILQHIDKQIYQRIADVGAQGILMVDCPPEEANAHCAQCQAHALDTIFLVTSITPEARLTEIAKVGSGFIYYVCHQGTTGMRDSLPEDYAQKVAALKGTTSLPVAAGFGISSAEMAKQILQHADGFIVGSYFVKAMGEQCSPERIGQMARALDPR